MNSFERNINNLNVLFFHYKEKNDINYNRETSLTKEEYLKIKEHFSIWGLNEIAVEYCFNSNIMISDPGFYELNKDLILSSIMTEFISLNKDLRLAYKKNKKLELDIEHFNKFKHLINEYIITLYHTQSVNKNGIINPIINIDEYKEILERVNDLKNRIDNFVSNTFMDFKEINYGQFMYYAWASYNYRLPESILFFETLYKFIILIKNQMMVDVNNFTFLNLNNVFSNIKDNHELDRYIVSAYIGLGKSYVMLGNKDDSKRIYKELLGFFKVTNKYLPETYLINYWSGQNRIIEAAIELYILEEDNKLKEKLKKKILRMYLYSRIENDPYEPTENTIEPLLVISQIIKILF